MRLPLPPLLLITDRQNAFGDILDIAEEAFSAGCRWLSLREKDLSPENQGLLLTLLLERGAGHGARISLHGDPAVAKDAGAHGVHLPAGADATAARQILGADALIGVSIHSADEARAIDTAKVDYVIAGPIFETASKPGYGPALGQAGLATIVKASAVPVLAIGGIDPENVAGCHAAGAGGIAVMGGVMRAKNPGATVTQLLDALRA